MVILLAMSLYLRILLQIVGQSWIKTIAPYVYTSFTAYSNMYVIASVISGNIALSLGMVGALSIVRFRNPVRSPLNLSVYFRSNYNGYRGLSSSLKWLDFIYRGFVTMVSMVFIFIRVKFI